MIYAKYNGFFVLYLLIRLLKSMAKFVTTSSIRASVLTSSIYLLALLPCIIR